MFGEFFAGVGSTCGQPHEPPNAVGEGLPASVAPKGDREGIVWCARGHSQPRGPLLKGSFEKPESHVHLTESGVNRGEIIRRDVAFPSCAAENQLRRVAGLLWFSGRQNPLDGCFHGHSRLIKHSDDILNGVPSPVCLTNEQPHPSCFFSQLVSVHLLERSFLVFFVVHGGGAYTG
jgi:hypothetical protein